MVKYWDARDLDAIASGIREAEKTTSGEIRVHLTVKSRENILEDAKAAFQKLGMHKTRERNGVLIFVDPKHHRFAILGDRGIDEKAGGDFWNCTRDLMEAKFRAGEWKEAIAEGVRNAGRKLSEHFPASGKNPDELSNEVTGD